MRTESFLLAGDIGGTKTNLAIYTGQGGAHSPLAEATYRSADYPSLAVIASEFLRRHRVEINAAVFGVAGPVEDGVVTTTNLPWQMDERSLAATLAVPRVCLLNDLVAVATAIPALAPADLKVLNVGQPNSTGPIAVIAPGTGLGEAFLLHDSTNYRAYPSEGGHADFAPGTPEEDELLAYMRQQNHHISWERVCSGLAIPQLYQYVLAHSKDKQPAWLTEKFQQSTDLTPIIIQAALDSEQSDANCQRALQLFVSILGAEAGNMALKFLATGGVYLGGGIPPRILPLLQSDIFLRAFYRKGRFQSFMKRVPVHVILNAQAALLGAAHYGLTHLR